MKRAVNGALPEGLWGLLLKDRPGYGNLRLQTAVRSGDAGDINCHLYTAACQPKFPYALHQMSGPRGSHGPFQKWIIQSSIMGGALGLRRRSAGRLGLLSGSGGTMKDPLRETTPVASPMTGASIAGAFSIVLLRETAFRDAGRRTFSAAYQYLQTLQFSWQSPKPFAELNMP